MQLNVMLTNKCNCRCPMCRHVQNATGEVMPIEKYFNILDQCDGLTIAGSRIDAIRLDGSREPLLYPQLRAAITETKRRNFGAYLVTNGVLLSEEVSSMLVDTDINYIRISVTGITGKVYRIFQGYGAADAEKQLESVTNNVKYLAKVRNARGSNMFISISFVITDESVQDANQAIQFWKNCGVDELGIYSDINQVEYDSHKGNTIKFHKGSEECKHSVTIATNGDVYPCCKAPGEKMSIGNCFDTPLKKIFTSKRYYEFISRVSSLDINLLPDGCKTCPAIASC